MRDNFLLTLCQLLQATADQVECLHPNPSPHPVDDLSRTNACAELPFGAKGDTNVNCSKQYVRIPCVLKCSQLCADQRDTLALSLHVGYPSMLYDASSHTH